MEKYRPNELKEIKGHVDIISVLSNYGGISSIPHLLFYGPPGTGKTSTILAMAKDFYAEKFSSMVMEVNASDERGIEIVTGKIKSFVDTQSLSGKGVKLVLLDEADALTVDAQSALRRIMETSTKGVRFCLCCNYSSKIMVPLQSRCTKFRFPGIGEKFLREKIGEIVIREGISIGEDAISSLIKLANGDARRAINLLQSAYLGNEFLSADYMYKVAGSPIPSDILLVSKSVMENSFENSFRFISNMLKENGYSMTDVVTELAVPFLDILSDHPFRLALVLDEFSNIEYNLSEGGKDSLAVGHLVSCFHMSV